MDWVSYLLSFPAVDFERWLSEKPTNKREAKKKKSRSQLDQFRKWNSLKMCCIVIKRCFHPVCTEIIEKEETKACVFSRWMKWVTNVLFLMSTIDKKLGVSGWSLRKVQTSQHKKLWAQHYGSSAALNTEHQTFNSATKNIFVSLCLCVFAFKKIN